MGQSREDASWHMCVCMCVLVFVRVHVYETEREGGRVRHRLYLELLLCPLNRHAAMHRIGSVYRRTLALSLDGHCVIT